MEQLPSVPSDSVDTTTQTQTNSITDSHTETVINIEPVEFVQTATSAESTSVTSANSEISSESKQEAQSPTWGPDTNTSDPQPITTPINAGIPDWESENQPIQSQDLTKDQAQTATSEPSQKQRKARRVRKRLNFESTPNSESKSNSESKKAQKPLLNTSDLQSDNLNAKLPKDIRIKRVPKSAKLPVQISHNWYHLRPNPTPVTKDEHWSLPLNLSLIHI